MNDECTEDFYISFSVQVDNKTLIIPRVSHDIGLNPEEMTTVVPSVATIIVAVTEKHVLHKLTQCHLVLKIRDNEVLVFPPPIYEARITEQEKQLGIRKILQVDQRTHYILQNQVGKKYTWLETEKFCNETLTANPFLYFSEAELMETGKKVIHDEPYIIFAGFGKKKQVRSFIFYLVQYDKNKRKYLTFDFINIYLEDICIETPAQHSLSQIQTSRKCTQQHYSHSH